MTSAQGRPADLPPAAGPGRPLCPATVAVGRPGRPAGPLRRPRRPRRRPAARLRARARRLAAQLGGAGPAAHPDLPRPRASTWPASAAPRAAADPTSVEANQQLLHRFLTEVAGTPAILVGNSMGGLIAAMQARRAPGDGRRPGARRPGAAHQRPGAGRTRWSPSPSACTPCRPSAGRCSTGAGAARTPEQSAMDVLRLCCSDPGRVPGGGAARSTSSWRASGTATPTSTTQFLMAARSLLHAAVPRPRARRQMLGGITAPVLLLHGDEDRLVPGRGRPYGGRRASRRGGSRWPRASGTCPSWRCPSGPPGTCWTGSPRGRRAPRDRARHATLD